MKNRFRIHQYMKLKWQFVAILLAGALLVGFLLGYRIGARDGLIFRSGNIFTKRDIWFGTVPDDFEKIFQVFDSITVEGINVSGKIISIDVKDVADIVEIITNTGEADPILSIRVISRSDVEVTTGIVRGPLDGGGNIYRVKKKNGQWTLDGKGSWIS